MRFRFRTDIFIPKLFEFTRPRPIYSAIAAVTVIASVVAGAASAVAAPTPPGAVEEPVQLALNWKPEPQFGGFYAAKLSGADKKFGLRLEILPGGSRTPVVQMVAAGKVDFGIVSADEVVLSRANGSDVIAIYAVFQTNPQAIMVHAERGFHSIADVFAGNGKLAWQKGLPYAQFLEQKFDTRAAGSRGGARGIQVQRVPYLGGVANFLTDPLFSQQCFLTAEPLAAQKAGARVQTFLVADEGFNPYTTVLVTRMAVVKKKPELVKRMVQAVRAGWESYLRDPEIANKQMQSLNKSMDASTFALSAATQKKLIETGETEKNGLGCMTKLRWEELAHQLKSLGLTKAEPSAESMFLIL